MKYIKRTFIGILFFVTLYLGIVWVWANSVAPSLLQEVSPDKTVAKLDVQFIAALIKVEDPSFYSHSGLDISKGQGLTTISSAAARTVFLGEHQLEGVSGSLQSFYRGFFSCCQKIDFGRDVMALVLDSHVTKQDQISIFMRSAYLGSHKGQGIIGFENAALIYYEKELPDLTKDEFYGLVAMLLAPNYYHPVKNPRIHAQRVKRVKAVISGQCEPDGWLDLTYEHCATDA